MRRRWNVLVARVGFLSLLLPSPVPILAAETDGGAAVNVRLTLGNQNKSLALGIPLFGAAVGGHASVEGGVSYTLGQHFQMFEVGSLGWGRSALSSTLDWQVQGALGQHRGFLGLDSGSPTPLFANDRRKFTAGLGLGQRYNWLPTRIKEFENVQGTLKVFFAHGDFRESILFSNDTRMYFPLLVLGGGTDLGPTASLLGRLDIRNGRGVLSLGIAHDMFTPLPDRTRPPTNTSVRQGKHGTYFTQGNFQNLYHGNTYTFAEFRERHWQASVKLGVDSQRLGAAIQDFIHNNVTGSPLFPGWDPNQPARLFLELSGAGLLSTRDY